MIARSVWIPGFADNENPINRQVPCWKEGVNQVKRTGGSTQPTDCLHSRSSALTMYVPSANKHFSAPYLFSFLFTHSFSFSLSSFIIFISVHLLHSLSFFFLFLFFSLFSLILWATLSFLAIIALPSSHPIFISLFSWSSHLISRALIPMFALSLVVMGVSPWPPRGVRCSLHKLPSSPYHSISTIPNSPLPSLWC